MTAYSLYTQLLFYAMVTQTTCAREDKTINIVYRADFSWKTDESMVVFCGKMHERKNREEKVPC